MKLPLFIVCADGDVLAYDDPKRALRYVESPDVEAGEYVAVFDAEGRRFKLESVEPTKTRKTWFITTVELVPVEFRALEEEPTGAGELRRILVQHLPGASEDTPLDELVRTSVGILRSP